MNDEQGCLYPIQIEEWRIFYIEITVLPRTPPHQFLSGLGGCSEGSAIPIHLTIEASEIAESICFNGCSKSLRLHEQRKRAVTSVTMSHHSQSRWIGNSQLNAFVHSRQNTF